MSWIWELYLYPCHRFQKVWSYPSSLNPSSSALTYTIIRSFQYERFLVALTTCSEFHQTHWLHHHTTKLRRYTPVTYRTCLLTRLDMPTWTQVQWRNEPEPWVTRTILVKTCQLPPLTRIIITWKRLLDHHACVGGNLFGQSKHWIRAVCFIMAEDWRSKS